MAPRDNHPMYCKPALCQWNLSRYFLTLLCALCALCGYSKADDPCRSGLQPGQRPGPYSAIIATGPERGQSYCYVCETGERPAVIIFARSLSEPLAQLARGVDKAVADHQSLGPRGWITFLNDDQVRFDPQVAQWAKDHAIRHLPLGVFEDTGGPPSYRLSRDADVTVLLFVKRQVVANFAFRAGEFKRQEISEVIKSLTGILKE
jgi:hypothetical protein